MEPLAQLKDIHLPEQIHNYPIAPGWWLLALLVLMLVIFSIRKIKKYRTVRKAKKMAVMQLKNNSLTNSELIALIKWAALQYFPRIDVASLYGAKLQDFMLKSLPEKHKDKFNALADSSFDSLYTKNDVDSNENFQQATLLWIVNSLPAKPSNTEPNEQKLTLNKYKEQNHD